MKRPAHRVIADEYLLHNWCDLNAFGAATPGESGSWGLIYKAEDNMGKFCRRCNPKQRGPYPNIRANEHKWRPIGSNENMPWVVVTIPDELEKNGQPQNEKMKFESSKHETKLSMKLTAQVQARILSKTHRV